MRVEATGFSLQQTSSRRWLPILFEHPRMERRLLLEGAHVRDLVITPKAGRCRCALRPRLIAALPAIPPANAATHYARARFSTLQSAEQMFRIEDGSETSVNVDRAGE